MISEKNYLTLGLPGAEAITSTIGVNCHVGLIQSEDTALLICGRVNGDVSCTGAVIVAEGAHITGGITAKSALIAGNVVSPNPQNPSSIKVEGAVILQATARVICHVEAGALETVIGAVVEGMLSLNRGMRAIDEETNFLFIHGPTRTEALTPAGQMDPHQFNTDMEEIKNYVDKGQEFASQGETNKLNAIITELKAVDLTQFQQFKDQATTVIEEALQTLEALDQASQPKSPLPNAFFQDGGAGFRPSGH